MGFGPKILSFSLLSASLMYLGFFFIFLSFISTPNPAKYSLTPPDSCS